MGQDYCYWDARSNADAIFIMSNQCIVAYLLLTAALRLPNLYSLRKTLTINVAHIAFIHLVVVLWGIAQSAVNFYSLTSFLQMPSEILGRNMLDYSHGYALAAAVPGFLVQTLFMTICVTFCKNLVREYDIRQFPRYSLKFVKLQRVYFYLRIAIRLAIFILIATCQDRDTEYFSTIEFISLIIDSFIINVLLTGALRVFLQRLSHPHFKPLKKEFYVMMACSFCRIIIDSMYLGLRSDGNRSDGYCVSEAKYHLTYTVLYNFMGNYFMHFIPIAFTLKVYNFDHREVQESDELIPRSDSNNSDSFEGRLDSLK